MHNLTLMELYYSNGTLAASQYHPGRLNDNLYLMQPETLKLCRTAYFNYHPHAGANRAGGVWVRSGDFKLLRWFGNPSTHELYNLREDISEANDLSKKMPDKVKELDALIDGFLKDTGALYPRPNPAYKPVAAKNIRKSSAKNHPGQALG